MAKKIIHIVSALNFIQEFNKIKRDKYWQKNEKKWKLIVLNYNKKLIKEKS